MDRIVTPHGIMENFEISRKNNQNQNLIKLFLLNIRNLYLQQPLFRIHIIITLIVTEKSIKLTSRGMYHAKN